jgi:hypothetical protein
MSNELTLQFSYLEVGAIIAAMVNDNEADPYYLSGSIANLGRHAGSRTWNNSKRTGEAFTVTDETAQAIRSHYADYGAWSEDELAAWTTAACIGMIVQCCAASANMITDWCDTQGIEYADLYAAIDAYQGAAEYGDNGDNGDTSAFFLGADRTAQFHLGV